jgi:hypothetical protein
MTAFRSADLVGDLGLVSQLEVGNHLLEPGLEFEIQRFG